MCACVCACVRVCASVLRVCVREFVCVSNLLKGQHTLSDTGVMELDKRKPLTFVCDFVSNDLFGADTYITRWCRYIHYKMV